MFRKIWATALTFHAGQFEPVPGKRPQPRRSANRKLALTSIAMALTAVPVVTATPAHATTTANGCTVTPHPATVIGLDQTGHKILDYKVTATCVKGVSLTVNRQFWEFDGYIPPVFGGAMEDGSDDYQGSRYGSFLLYGGTTQIHVTRTLNKTDFDAYEEPYQRVRFRVVIIDSGLTSGWSNWERAAYTRILY